jgi:hypothetical protein
MIYEAVLTFADGSMVPAWMVEMEPGCVSYYAEQGNTGPTAKRYVPPIQVRSIRAAEYGELRRMVEAGRGST